LVNGTEDGEQLSETTQLLSTDECHDISAQNCYVYIHVMLNEQQF